MFLTCPFLFLLYFRSDIDNCGNIFISAAGKLFRVAAVTIRTDSLGRFDMYYAEHAQ